MKMREILQPPWLISKKSQSIFDFMNVLLFSYVFRNINFFLFFKGLGVFGLLSLCILYC